MADVQNVQQLRAMYADVKENVNALEGSVKQVESQQEALTQEKNAIEDAVMNEASSKLNTYLTDVKTPMFGSLPSVRLVFGSTYGDVTNASAIIDWIIEEEVSTPGPLPGDPPVLTWETIYQFEGIGWDGDETIQGYVDDWIFSHDYLNQPLGAGGTYGINPNISSLEGAKEILTNNTDKIKDSKAVFAKYIQV
jgi:hypothetical protein